MHYILNIFATSEIIWKLNAMIYVFFSSQIPFQGQKSGVIKIYFIMKEIESFISGDILKDSSPKNGNSVIILVPNLYEFRFSVEHKGRYFEEGVYPGCFGAPLTSILGKIKYYGSQWCPRTALFPTFFRISSFVFSRTKTFTQVWNYMRVSQWWQNLHFWVNYPFKLNKNYSKYIYSKIQIQTIQSLFKHIKQKHWF